MFLAYGFDVRPRFGRIGSGAGDLRGHAERLAAPVALRARW